MSIDLRLLTSRDLDKAALAVELAASAEVILPQQGLRHRGGDQEVVVVAAGDAGYTAVELLGEARESWPGRRTLVVCPRPTESERVRLLAEGPVELLEPGALEPREIAARILSELLPEVCRRPTFQGLVGVSRAMTALFELIEQVAPFSDPVLIVGETGVGKELVAKALHQVGRPGRPWVATNIAASSDQLVGSDLFGHAAGAFTGADRNRRGLLSEAANGTLLLDEIGDLDLKSQIKLLRLIEERRYRPLGANREEELGARLVLATHRDLDGLVENGTFRQDLYERIRPMRLEVPPLRSRMEDLGVLTTHFLEEFSRTESMEADCRMPPQGMDLLFRSSWPGNVRELRGVLRRAAALSSTGDGAISLSVLRDCTRRVRSAGDRSGIRVDPESETLALAERRFRRSYLLRSLELSDQNVATAARLADISRARFYELLKELEIGR